MVNKLHHNFHGWVPYTIIWTIFFLGCADKNRAELSRNSANQTKAGIPGIKLQRVFGDISMDGIVWLTQSPGEDDVWYVVEKRGRVLRIERSNTKSNGYQSRVFIDITDRVDAGPNEAGLLSMAFHPQYATNGYVYLSYTGNDGGLVSYVSRFEPNGDKTMLLPESEKKLLQAAQPYGNHNGGHILFGPDGYLYFGLGDGGAGGDPQGNGQNTKTLLGSLLRIDVNGGDPYAIPASNPFANHSKGRPEIYAWGLRNPWRWSFDRGTKYIWLADVGQNAWEEVDIITHPGNFGWNGKEGTHCYEASKCNNSEFIDPVIEYSHELGCSITGGYVYRGKAIAGLEGTYIYGDFCSGTVWGAKNNDDGNYKSFKLLESGLNIASFAESNDGELYVVHIRGEIYRITAK